MLKKEYPYLYETHMHTCESSACARSTGKEMAQAAKEAGYTGIIITDHSWYGNHCIDAGLVWEDWITQFVKGYENARKWGEQIGLDVFFGYESCYHGTEFLVYGVDKEWLLSHPQIKDASIKEQHQLIKMAGGMVIHAHPYREAGYIPEIRLFPEDVDGVEGINATHSSSKSTGHHCPEFDSRAIAYAKRQGLPMTAGSDVHTSCLLGGGIAFKRKLLSIKDFCQAVLGGEEYLLTNGDSWFNKAGEPL